MELPAELIQLMCKNIRSKRDLGNLRLVCKTFSILVLPFLYEEILLWRSPEAIKKANLIAQYYGPYVRTIALCIFRPQAVERKFYDERVEPKFYTGPVHHHALLERGYNYLPERFEKFEGSDHVDMESICNHLSTILDQTRSIRRFILLRETTIGLHWWDEQQSCDHETYCISQDLCTIFSAPNDSAFWDHTIHGNLIPRLLQVLAEAPTPIRDLEADGVFHIGSISHSEVQSLPAVFKHLINVYLNLDRAPVRFTRPWISKATIVQGLRVADKLQSMNLHFPGGIETFPEILGGCHFPALVKLELCSRKVLESDLLGFLRHLTSLRSLILINTKILKGTWRSLLSQVRKSLQVRHARFAQLRSYVKEERLVIRALCFEVEAWVCGDGSDPFEPMSGEDVGKWEDWLWDYGIGTDDEASEEAETESDESEDGETI